MAVFGSSAANETEIVIADVDMPLNAWSHVVVTYNGRVGHAEAALWLNCRCLLIVTVKHRHFCNRFCFFIYVLASNCFPLMVMQSELGTLATASSPKEVGIIFGDQKPTRGSRLFNGQLDEFMMFDRVLRGVQIVDIYQWAIADRSATTSSPTITGIVVVVVVVATKKMNCWIQNLCCCCL
jgi:hypothetical protein